MSKRLGKVFIKLDGELLESMGGATLDLGGVERPAVEGDNDVLGYYEKPKASKCDCKIALGPNTSLGKIKDITDATLTFECDTGQTYIVRNAWVSETLELSSGNGGEVKVVLMGPAAVEA